MKWIVVTNGSMYLIRPAWWCIQTPMAHNAVK
jgi:hypothetical protein